MQTKPSTDKALAFAMAEYLQTYVKSGAASAEAAESLEVAIQCITESFGVNLNSVNDAKDYSLKPATLKTIFEVFLEKRSARKDPVGSSKPTSTPSAPGDDAAKRIKAEEFKQQGNNKLKAKDFTGAVTCYTEAIALVADPIYYSNRAAAHSEMRDYESAIKDCQEAIAIDAKFSKAYSRLGLAYFSLGKFEEAVDAYESGLALDPSNENLKSSLDAARKKLAPSPIASKAGHGHSHAGGCCGGDEQDEEEESDVGGGMPSFGGAGMPGGMDFASILNNPQLMSMASKLMQSGALNGILNDPSVMQGLNDVRSGKKNPMDLLSNPDLMQKASQVMQENPDLADSIRGTTPDPHQKK